MPTKPQSWKKIRNQRRKENFVGRADQLRVFSDNYVRARCPNYMVFAVTGEGGVGKSTLLTQYEAPRSFCQPSTRMSSFVMTRQMSPCLGDGLYRRRTGQERTSSTRASTSVTRSIGKCVRKSKGMRKCRGQWVNMLALGVSDLTH